MKSRCWLGVLLWIVTLTVTGQGAGFTWNFETDESTWRARVETVKAMRVSTLGATPTSQACLQIAGTSKEGWNYAYPDRVAMSEKRRYRLSAWVRVDTVESGTPMPYLKCQFIASGSDGSPGMVLTDRYRQTRMGQWQRLTCEFETPAGVTEGALAFEKGTSDTTTIRAYLDDVTLQPVLEAQVYLQYSLPEIPGSLEAVRGVHPRLFLNAERIAELQQAIQTTHASLWTEIRAYADGLASTSPPLYQPPTSSGDAQLWQRPVGNAMPYLALAYKLTGESRYLDAAKEWALASCTYPTWGAGSQDGMHLATGHQLFGLATVYDWCYHDLDRSTRDRIRSTLQSRSSAMFQAVATGDAWWYRSFLQNQLWVNTAGIGAAGLVLFDEDDEALLWIGLVLDKFKSTMNALGPDGASYEGVGYWEYGAEHMLKFMYPARDLLDINFYDCPWWKNTARYCLYLSLPYKYWTRNNCVVDISDSPRGHWYGPDHILRNLAATYGDGYAQWLAEQIDAKNVDSANAKWLGLLSYAPSVKPTGPQSLPTLHEFEDLGLVSARTGWSGNDNLLIFKCGPFLGHKAVTELSFAPGGGHSHPDAGHFVVFGNGEWLVRDDGYLNKWTRQHNTLLIDGTGQLGEGSTAFQGTEPFNLRLHPRVLEAVSRPEYDHIAGDATEAYPSSLGLKRFVRHLLFIKPDVLLVLDDVLCGTDRNMELRFHLESLDCDTAGGSPTRNKALGAPGRVCTALGENTILQVILLTPESTPVQIDCFTEQYQSDKPDTCHTIKYSRTGRSWRNATALSWAPVKNDANPTASSPNTVTLQNNGSVWQFFVGNKKVEFNWNSGEATVQ